MAVERSRAGLLLGCVLLVIVGAALSAKAALLLLLLAVPALAEVMREAGRRWPLSLCLAAVGGAGWLLFSRDAAFIATAWCALAVAMIWVPTEKAVTRGVVWSAMTAAVICVALLVMNLHYHGMICDGLASGITQWIAEREDAAAILLRAYQSGLAGLEGNLAMLPAVRLFGNIVMPDQVRSELLKGLHTTLTLLLEYWLPSAIVNGIGLTGLLCAMLPDVYRARRGKPRRLPPFGAWRLPQQMTGLTLLLLLGSLLRYFTGSMVTARVSVMCGAAFQDIYMILGMCTASELMKWRGTGRGTRRLILAVGAIMAPFVLVVIGMADQAVDLRKMSRSMNKGG